MKRRILLGGFGAALSGAMLPLGARAGQPRQPTGYLRTNWSRDPFALGSYSFVAKGARQRDRRVLGRPLGSKVFFAGEAVHPGYNSTVHAALESGRMAAAAILDTDARMVAVVGAGVSGLALARDLESAGRDVVVFEARGRIGGRVHTVPDFGAPMELGASWIHGQIGNPLVTMADALGLAREVTDGSYRIRGGDGREMRDRDAPGWLDEVTEVQHTAGASRAELNWTAYILQDDYGGEDAVLPGGYHRIVAALAEGLDIRLGHTVTGVSHGTDGVTLRGGGHSARVDCAAVTVPLGVLKAGTIAFDPPLPDDKTSAIRRLGMGLLDKVYLRFDSAFWDPDVTWILTPETGLPEGAFNQWLNLDKVLGVPVLLAFNGGPPARALADLPDEEIVAQATSVLAKAYPGQGP